MLTIITVFPVIGIITLCIVSENNEKTMKRISLSFIIVCFVISIVIWTGFDSSITDYQYTTEFTATDFCHLNMGVDGISIYFVILTTFIIPIAVISNWNNITNNIKYFLISFLVLETLLICVFVVLDIILFYIFFESVLIPLFLIVGIWGGGESRIRAAFLLFLYTLFGSLFILLAFINIYNNIGSTDFEIIGITDISLESQKILWIPIFISMAIKTPIIPINTWLTYAHSEAPVGGSVVLAGVILKLATYGYLRIILQFLPDASNYYSPLVQTVCTVSIIYSSLVTIRQTDFKKLIAYSSVAHIALVVLALFSNTIQGIEGGIILSISHGFVSPALFFLVGGVLYDRFHTRTIRYYRGIVIFIPMFSVLFFIFSIFNAAVPLSANWIGEFISLTGIFISNFIVGILCSTSIVLSACYSIWMFNRISFGSYSKFLHYVSDINRREYIIIIPLLFITILLGIFPNIVLDHIHMSVSTLMYSNIQLFI